MLTSFQLQLQTGVREYWRKVTGETVIPVDVTSIKFPSGLFGTDCTHRRQKVNEGISTPHEHPRLPQDVKKILPDSPVLSDSVSPAMHHQGSKSFYRWGKRQ